MNALVKLENATKMLAEVRDAHEAKNLMAMASAAEHYARKAKLGQEAIDYAHAIKIDAERMLGGFLKAAEKQDGARGRTGGGTRGSKKEPQPDAPPTLASLGLTKKVSSASQALHAIAEKDPEQFAAIRAGKLSVSKARRILDEQDRTEELNKAKRSTSKQAAGIDIRVADALDTLASLPPASVDCIVTDPPYNVTEYDWDQYPDPDGYLKFIRLIMVACQRVLKPDYHLFLFADAAYMARMENIVLEVGLELKSRLIWVRKNMSMGRVVEDRFISQWDPIFHCGTKPLNLPAEWGSERGDVQEFAVPQTNFNDKKIHPTQKPLALVQRLVELGSDAGQLVVDPFCGGGTTAVACHILKRQCITCDTNSDYVALAKARLHG